MSSKDSFDVLRVFGQNDSTRDTSIKLGGFDAVKLGCSFRVQNRLMQKYMVCTVLVGLGRFVKEINCCSQLSAMLASPGKLLDCW